MCFDYFRTTGVTLNWNENNGKQTHNPFSLRSSRSSPTIYNKDPHGNVELFYACDYSLPESTKSGMAEFILQ